MNATPIRERAGSDAGALFFWNHSGYRRFLGHRNLEGLAMAKEKMLKDLFHDTLKDIYFAEKKILGALPKMAKKVSRRRARRPNWT